ncbi:MAG: hypothetical protein LBU85_13060 [Treponema sp.]|jgi:hypothetical protein|nr:hypothetical protein [Treponema sp.]
MKTLNKKTVSLWGALALLAVFGVIMPMSVSANAAANTGIDFNIRFFDRRIYYAESDPINIQITITNNTPLTYRFKLADERVFSIDFDVRTVSNRQLEPADALIRKRTQYQQVFFREIAVESGESFSFVEDLRNYVKITQAGSFVVQARVYPELNRPAAGVNVGAIAGANNTSTTEPFALESKRLSLSIWPPLATTAEGIPLEMDVATGAVLVRERLAPDQVVDYMISARQKSQWEKFYLYLDLEEMLKQDSARQRKWLTESEEGRKRMVDQYRQELKNSTIDGISVIPTDYLIEMTQYNNFSGKVIVLEKFKNTYFTELKRYTYDVRFKDNVWTITGYSVTNLGTE